MRVLQIFHKNRKEREKKKACLQQTRRQALRVSPPSLRIFIQSTVEHYEQGKRPHSRIRLDSITNLCIPANRLDRGWEVPWLVWTEQ